MIYGYVCESDLQNIFLGNKEIVSMFDKEESDKLAFSFKMSTDFDYFRKEDFPVVSLFNFVFNDCFENVLRLGLNPTYRVKNTYKGKVRLIELVITDERGNTIFTSQEKYDFNVEDAKDEYDFNTEVSLSKENKALALLKLFVQFDEFYREQYTLTKKEFCCMPTAMLLVFFQNHPDFSDLNVSTEHLAALGSLSLVDYLVVNEIYIYSNKGKLEFRKAKDIVFSQVPEVYLKQKSNNEESSLCVFDIEKLPFMMLDAGYREILKLKNLDFQCIDDQWHVNQKYIFVDTDKKTFSFLKEEQSNLSNKKDVTFVYLNEKNHLTLLPTLEKPISFNETYCYLTQANLNLLGQVLLLPESYKEELEDALNDDEYKKDNTYCITFDQSGPSCILFEDVKEHWSAYRNFTTNLAQFVF